MPDDEWGRPIGAVIVPHDGASLDEVDVQGLARQSLRGSKTPEIVILRDSLPDTETGSFSVGMS